MKVKTSYKKAKWLIDNNKLTKGDYDFLVDFVTTPYSLLESRDLNLAIKIIQSYERRIRNEN